MVYLLKKNRFDTKKRYYSIPKNWYKADDGFEENMNKFLLRTDIFERPYEFGVKNMSEDIISKEIYRGNLSNDENINLFTDACKDIIGITDEIIHERVSVYKDIINE